MTNENAVVQVIDELSSKLGIAIDWSDENILPYLKDLVDRYAIYMKNYAWFLIITGIVMSILGFIGLVGFIKPLSIRKPIMGDILAHRVVLCGHAFLDVSFSLG